MTVQHARLAHERTPRPRTRARVNPLSREQREPHSVVVCPIRSTTAPGLPRLPRLPCVVGPHLEAVASMDAADRLGRLIANGADPW